MRHVPCAHKYRLALDMARVQNSHLKLSFVCADRGDDEYYRFHRVNYESTRDVLAAVGLKLAA
jgi:hypothetical protein